MYEDTEECGNVSHNTTDHETTTTAAAIPAVKNNIPPLVCDKEAAEHAGKAILQAKACARSGERNEHASSDSEHEFNRVSAEDLGHLHRRIKGDEGAHITRIDCGLYDQGIDRAVLPTTPTKRPQRQRPPERQHGSTPTYRPVAPKEKTSTPPTAT